MYPMKYGRVFFLDWCCYNESCEWIHGIYPYSRSIRGLYLLSGRTSYREISWSFEVVRLDIPMIISFWDLTGILAAPLPSCLSNFIAIGKVETRIPHLRDFMRSRGKMSVHHLGKRVIAQCCFTGIIPTLHWGNSSVLMYIYIYIYICGIDHYLITTKHNKAPSVCITLGGDYI